MKGIIPQIGAWYQDNIDRLLFEVVAFDESSATIDVQYRDGELAEFDIETWQQLNLSHAEAPEDASAPFEENFEEGDHWGLNEVLHPRDWDSPVNSIEAEPFTGYEDLDI